MALPMLALGALKYAPAAFGIAKSLFGRKRQAAPAPDMGGNRFDQAIMSGWGQAQGAENDYINRLNEFDPTAGIGESLNANLDAQEEQFAGQYEDFAGGQAGGTLGTGFGMKSRQDLVQQGMRDRAAIRQQASERMNQARASHLDRIGQVTMARGDRYFNALADRTNTQEAQKLSDRAGRRSMWGQVAGAAIGAAPALYNMYKKR